MSSLRSNLSPVPELAIDLERGGGALRRQIEASIRQRIRSGALLAGVALPRGGLIFGYSNLGERAIADGITRLARAVSTVART